MWLYIMVNNLSVIFKTICLINTTIDMIRLLGKTTPKNGHTCILQIWSTSFIRSKLLSLKGLGKKPNILSKTQWNGNISMYEKSCEMFLKTFHYLGNELEADNNFTLGFPILQVYLIFCGWHESLGIHTLQRDPTPLKKKQIWLDKSTTNILLVIFICMWLFLNMSILEGFRVENAP